MTVSSSTNRVSYAGNGSTTVFPYTYKIFDEDDLTVILRAANGVETTKTIVSDYTVSGVGNAGGGNVTMLTAPASGETLVVLREQDLIQELDIVPNDPFPADSLEGALDKLTFMVQQHEETLGRTIKASRTNTITGSEFTILAADRANKVFAFDSAGDVSIAQELGTYRGNWAASTAFAERDIVKDTSNNNIYICLTAHTSSGAQPISSNADVAKWALLVDAAAATSSASSAAASASAASTSETNAASSASSASTSATNAAASASAASTSATNAAASASAASASAAAAGGAASNAFASQSSAGASAAAAAASLDAFTDIYLGAKSSDPTVDNDGDPLTVGDQYFNSVANELRIWNGSIWQTAVGGIVDSLTVVTNASQTGAFSGTITGTTMDINTVISGSISVGDIVYGPDASPITRVTAFGTGTGGLGTYTVSVSQSTGNTLIFTCAEIPTIRISDTDPTVNTGQPHGAVEFFTSDADSAGVGAYVSAISEDSTPDTALIFGTRDDAGGSVDANERMRITSLGRVGIATDNPATALDVNGTITADGFVSSGDMTFGDNDKAIFGAGSDLQIYHDGSQSIIHDAGTGNLRIKGSDITLQDADGNGFISMVDGGAGGTVFLKHLGSNVLATTATGIDVTGTVTADGLTVDGAGSFTQAGGGLKVLNEGSAGHNANIFFGIPNQTDGWTIGQGVTADDGVFRLYDNGGGGIKMSATSGGDISFYEDTGTTPKFFWDASTERLGIGNAAPTTALDVTGTITADGLTVDGNIALRNADNITFKDTGGAARGILTFDANNDIVIGPAGAGIQDIKLKNNGAITRLNIDVGGDISFYEDTGTTAKFFWDASAESLGLGTVSPSAKLEVAETDSVTYSSSAIQGDLVVSRKNLAGTVNQVVGLQFDVTGYLGTTTGVAGISAIQTSSVSSAALAFQTRNAGTIGERMRIDASGNLLVGKTSSSISTEGVDLRADGQNYFVRDGGTSIFVNRLTSDGSLIDLRKDGATVGSIGSAFSGSSMYIDGASSRTGIYFATSSWTPRINGANVDNQVDLGGITNRFDDIYATNGTIQTSDRNEKQDIEELSEAEQRVAVACKGLLRKFRWKDAVEEKGDDARIHFGIIAQDLQDAFEAEGLDAGRYAMFISSTWTDEETGEERSRMGVRYPQLLAFIIAAI
jgi:hypothetical protein